MFSKKSFILLLLFLLVSGSTLFSIDITPEQLSELTGILNSYTELTTELQTTLTQQRRTLSILETTSEAQALTIQQLKTSFQGSQKQMKSFEDSYRKYQKTQIVKDYILYGCIGVLVISVIYVGAK